MRGAASDIPETLFFMLVDSDVSSFLRCVDLVIIALSCLTLASCNDITRENNVTFIVVDMRRNENLSKECLRHEKIKI